MKDIDNKNDERWFAIVNPVAGKGRGLLDWPVISSLLHNAGIVMDALFTERKFHATELAVYAVNRGYKRIIIVGGDGTIHETVNGLFIQNTVPTNQITLAVIAVGTGNDWIRMFGIPRTYPEAVRSIVQGYTFLQDVGRVSYHECRVPQVRYLANVAGVAYDAAVCDGFNKLHSRGYRGKWLYVWSAFREAVRYTSKPAVIEVDGNKIFEGRLFTATIGVCKYTGGGLSQTPLAVADDGLFDLTIIPRMNRFVLFWKHWHTLFDGRIYEIPRVTLHRGARIIIKSQPPIRLELDGEILGESGIDFQIVEKAIKVIVSESFINESK